MSCAWQRGAAVIALLLSSGNLRGAVVHVRESLSVCGEIVSATDRLVQTGERYNTSAPPDVEGARFVQWTISTEQPFNPRDNWGRSFDSVSFTVYEDTEVVAVYIDDSEDADDDGVPDALEVYWYGDLSQDAESDTDGDGVGFLDELLQKRNPLFAEDCEFGCILVFSSRDVLYNPNGYAPYVIRSEPENALFETRRVYASPGDIATTESFDPHDSRFAFWTLNGFRVSDEWGVASNAVSIVASDQVFTECIAHVIDDEIERNSYYWYGKPCAVDSDIDGDGYTFAEELELGLSPVFKDSLDSGVVLSFGCQDVLYNPLGYVPYTIRSEPEGALFGTVNEWRLPGTVVRTPELNPLSSDFAYWMLDGVRQQDSWGVAKDSVQFSAQSNELVIVAIAEKDVWKRLSQYWYGDSGHGPESDEDNDGIRFRDELERGLSPVFADESESGRILAFDSNEVEVSLQDYEHVRGVVIDDDFVDLFCSKSAGVSGKTFFDGAAIYPVVADVNADGLWDIVVVRIDGGERRIYTNCGTKGNPQFVEEKNPAQIVLSSETLAMNSIEGINSLSLDVMPVGALSMTFAGEDVLVSDKDGRIWFYHGHDEGGGVRYLLQHKVWGGTYAGFATGLRIAAVDWEDDGDWDCLCGTAEGRLMLLRDPKVGRPTNLRALAGIDNVLLEWNPNVQSRVRGYNVYRDDSLVASSAVPRHRDWPQLIRSYDYKVTAISRYYTAGNSSPILTESVPSDAVHAELGKVVLSWGSAADLAGDEIKVMLCVENSLNLSCEGLLLEVGYDTGVLTPTRVETSGLTEGVAIDHVTANGLWRITASDGVIASGAGTLFTLVFKGERATEGSAICLRSAAFKSVKGTAVMVVLPQADATVAIEESGQTPITCYGRGDVDGNGRLSKEDLQMMAKLMQGGPKPKWNADQLRAGDYNGDGKLDNNDYQLMRADFREKGVL